MSVADATRAEVEDAYRAVAKLEIALRQVYDGSGSPEDTRRFDVAAVDAAVTAAAEALAPLEGEGGEG